MYDVTVESHGSIVLVRPHTDAAREWIDEKVSDDHQLFGDALVVEPRYFRDLAAGMLEDGLKINWRA